MQPKQLGPYEQLVQYREQLAADLARVENQVRPCSCQPWKVQQETRMKQQECNIVCLLACTRRVRQLHNPDLLC